jgi:hypothetical protein
MAEADTIMMAISQYNFQLPIEQRLVGTEDEIQAVCEQHRQLWTDSSVGYEQNATILQTKFGRKRYSTATKA